MLKPLNYSENYRDYIKKQLKKCETKEGFKGVLIQFTDMFFFSFLLVPRNKKRPPKTKQPVFGRSISIKLLYYCGE